MTLRKRLDDTTKQKGWNHGLKFIINIAYHLTRAHFTRIQNQ
jgi:hypothetical protein